MEIIKEYTTRNARYYFSIRSNTYSKTLDFFNALFEIAHKDFVFIEQSDVYVVLHLGIRYKRTYGIRFSIPIELVPEPKDYVYIDRFEDVM